MELNEEQAIFLTEWALQCASRWVLDIPETSQICIAGARIKNNRILTPGAVFTMPRENNAPPYLITDCSFDGGDPIGIAEALGHIIEVELGEKPATIGWALRQSLPIWWAALVYSWRFVCKALCFRPNGDRHV